MSSSPFAITTPRLCPKFYHSGPVPFGDTHCYASVNERPKSCVHFKNLIEDRNGNIIMRERDVSRLQSCGDFQARFSCRIRDRVPQVEVNELWPLEYCPPGCAWKLFDVRRKGHTQSVVHLGRIYRLESTRVR